MAGELYHHKLIALLEQVWGLGFLSPGGTSEVSRLIGGTDFSSKSVLDIGCGAGGIDIALVAGHGAGYVTGIDVEDTVISHARMRIAGAGLDDRIGLVKIAPGPLPFAPATFDIVFSKDSIVHIPDKNALMAEVFRVLRPGGWFVASDWLIAHDNTPSPAMRAYVAAEGLDFGMASPARYRAAMRACGFDTISTRSRNKWYREVARDELARMQGPWRKQAARQLGKAFVDHNIKIWTLMLAALESGEHCPTHLKAHKPA